MAYDGEKDEYIVHRVESCGRRRKGAEIRDRPCAEGNGLRMRELQGMPRKREVLRTKKTDKIPLEERTKRLNVSKYFARQREAMEKKISTAEGILLRVNRSIQAEGVFAMIKEDMNFRRFLTRGNRNVQTEWYLVSMAYNIWKLHHKIQTGRLGSHLFAQGAA